MLDNKDAGPFPMNLLVASYPSVLEMVRNARVHMGSGVFSIFEVGVMEF
jgi:hypothetical protein